MIMLVEAHGVIHNSLHLPACFSSYINIVLFQVYCDCFSFLLELIVGLVFDHTDNFQPEMLVIPVNVSTVIFMFIFYWGLSVLVQFLHKLNGFLISFMTYGRTLWKSDHIVTRRLPTQASTT